VLRATGRYADARLLYGFALAICEARLGDAHPLTRLVRANLQR
jgi:hypothetical protein